VYVREVSSCFEAINVIILHREHNPFLIPLANL
jgi:hypothetical protein